MKPRSFFSFIVKITNIYKYIHIYKYLGFGSEEKILRGRGDIKRFEEEMGWEFAGYGIEMSGFIVRNFFI